MTLPTSVEGVAARHRARSLGIGRAHAKAILLGEHAVVFGTAALALPVAQLSVTASAGWSAGVGAGEVSYTVTGSASQVLKPPDSAGLQRLTAEFLTQHGAGQMPGLEVILDGSVPHGRGLGSSAASARALVLALADLFGAELNAQAVFDLVQTAENMAHGRASGIDAMAVGATGPLLFQAGRAEHLPIGGDGLFILADSGTPGSTKEAAARLREGFTRRTGAQQAFLTRAADLVDAGRQALTAGTAEEFGPLLSEYHELMRAAGLSTEHIDELVAAAHKAGSLGAKITGGGLGGCVLAQVHPEQARQVTRRLYEAGAVRCWAVPLKGQNNHAQ